MKNQTDFFDYLHASPTAPHTARETVRRLTDAGYVLLREDENWQGKICAGGKYVTERNNASVIAFRIPADAPAAFMVVASHGDSPTFAVMPGGSAAAGKTTRLTVEKYGSMLCATWFDRPLSVAGIIGVRDGNGIAMRHVSVDRDLVMIPSVAIHMNRNANESATYNPAVDMQPLFGGENATSLMATVADAAGVPEKEILSSQLWLYNRQEPTVFGAMGEFIGAARLDDLACAYTALNGFLSARDTEAVPVYVLFDSEEVGSATRQGAGSSFLAQTLRRISDACGGSYESFCAMLAGSMLLSADNAHAVHPNHPEYADAHNAPALNGGVVIKYNANCRYATDAAGEGVFRRICEEAGIPTQTYCNRPDITGGSTLGSVSIAQVPVMTVDMGLAQLSMHSAYETAGTHDMTYLERAFTAFYGTALTPGEHGGYRVDAPKTGK